MKLLLASGADINSASKSGSTILHAAAKKGQLEVSKYLITEIEFPIDSQKGNGVTPLGIAAYEGQEELVKYFENQITFLPSST